MKNIKNEEKAKENFWKLFEPEGGGQLDGEVDLSDTDKNDKYSDKVKGTYLDSLIKRYPLDDDEIFNRFKRCLPNGWNNRYSIEDSEYEALKKEFGE